MKNEKPRIKIESGAEGRLGLWGDTADVGVGGQGAGRGLAGTGAWGWNNCGAVFGLGSYDASAFFWGGRYAPEERRE